MENGKLWSEFHPGNAERKARMGRISSIPNCCIFSSGKSIPFGGWIQKVSRGLSCSWDSPEKDSFLTGYPDCSVKHIDLLSDEREDKSTSKLSSVHGA